MALFLCPKCGKEFRKKRSKSIKFCSYDCLYKAQIEDHKEKKLNKDKLFTEGPIKPVTEWVATIKRVVYYMRKKLEPTAKRSKSKTDISGYAPNLLSRGRTGRRAGDTRVATAEELRRFGKHYVFMRRRTKAKPTWG